MTLSEKLFKEGKGILRLKPTWVPRSFCRPGKRIKLHPDDYYVLGLQKGGIDERWFASTTWAENGPGTPEDEGLSYVVSKDGTEKVLLRDMVDELKGELIGNDLWDKYHKWPMFSKFFDNAGPLPHHIHHRDQHANRVGSAGKPEMYFFPSQMNNHGGEYPYTFFGLNPEAKKEDIKKCLENFTKGDNHLLDHSQAYKIELDTGWDVPPGVLHAPASLCTYEPQFASDVYAMYQSVLANGQCLTPDLLWKNTPKEELGNYDYLMDVIDWEANVDPDFKKHHFMKPVVIHSGTDYVEEWICYLSKLVCAKRLTVYPGQKVVIKDNAAYGLIMLQGHGKMNDWDIETPALIRYGQLTNDEYFVSEKAASEGVVIENTSATDPIVMLKHFAENKDLIAFFKK
ncbi:MAG: hypothetical protein MJ248_03375 [Bacilli bacterium]|nr:hypothetical protein [Bacilli bacterium]